MAPISETAVLNGRKVARGDKIISFRGEPFTFKYMYGGKVYTEEREHALNPQVFPAGAKEKA